MNRESSIIPRNVEDEVKESYLRYSMSVIISRALPDVRDGLKPSQRRILFAMRQLNLSPGGKHRKCAKICGDTSGDYHPHGESVIYPTLVRMAQQWMMRYPLVDGQGNFGSVDGDPPAAMRYTEARQTQAAVALMEDLDKDTVDFIPNYDETKTEPTVFPAKFPNLLLNGSSGIAVGMATNIPPHHMGELVAAINKILDEPAISIEEIMKLLPGPDFPTGGIISGYRGIKEAFYTGRGKLIVRGTFHLEEKEKQSIIIDELPYNVSKSAFIQQIADLINGKSIEGISTLRDESDKEGMRIVLELKRGEVPDIIINQLYKQSDMQTTFGCNMLALDKGMPRTMNIKQMIKAWIDHRIESIRRRTRFDLNKAELRSHILEGYLRALDHLEAIVQLIRSSSQKESAKRALMEHYTLSERQAQAVLELRLYQLTHLESQKIEEEHKELQAKIAHYRSILENESMVHSIIKEELATIKATHNSPRRTQIIPQEEELELEDLIAKEPVIITISEDDYIKRMPIDTFREQRRGGQGVIGVEMKREGDSLKKIQVASTHDNLTIFSNFGRCYWLKVWQINESGRRSKGRPLVSWIEDIRPNERIAAILPIHSFEEEGSIILATKRGVIKKTALSEFSSLRRKGIYAINIDENDELISAQIAHQEQQIMLFTRYGMAVRFDEESIRSIGRVARGVRGISLKNEEDRVVSCEVVSPQETLLIVCENGYGKRSKVDDFRKTHRGGVGVRSIITSSRNGQLVAALSVTDHDSVLLMSAAGQTLRMSMSQLRLMGRSTQGVRLVQLPPNDKIVAVQKIEAL